MTQQKSIHLPWNQYDRYWICLWPLAGSLTQTSVNALTALGFQKRTGDRHYYVCLTGKAWNEVWQKAAAELDHCGADVEVAVIASDEEPDDRQISFSHKPIEAMHKIASNLWLGDAILSNRVVSYKQPVVSAKDVPVGYESFARVIAADGNVIAGRLIIEAARALGIEYALDRYLHVLAIKTYVQAGLEGFLFINFFPGFIQRPEVYLEGLSEAVRMHGVSPRDIVLDFTDSETQQDFAHLLKVTQYCRERGYAIALDDISSVATAETLIAEVQPDFVKLDRMLSVNCQRASDVKTLTNIISAAHRSKVKVIAEGIETEQVFTALQALHVDFFQGYLFSPPVAVSSPLRRTD